MADDPPDNEMPPDSDGDTIDIPALDDVDPGYETPEPDPDTP